MPRKKQAKRKLTPDQKRMQELGRVNYHAGPRATEQKLKNARTMASYEAEAERRGIPVSRVIAEAIS